MMSLRISSASESKSASKSWFQIGLASSPEPACSISVLVSASELGSESVLENVWAFESPRHDLVAEGRFDRCSEHDFVVGAAGVASSLRVRCLDNIRVKESRYS
jgi:hypothetical protein